MPRVSWEFGMGCAQHPCIQEMDMRRVGQIGQNKWAPVKLTQKASTPMGDMLQLLDEKNLAAVSGMGFTALGAYFFFFIQHLQSEVIGVTMLCVIMGFLMALLLKIEVLHIDLKPKESLNIRFMTGVIFMLSLVIIGSAINYFGGQAGHALIAFLLTSMSTYILFHSRVEIDDHRTPHRS